MSEENCKGLIYRGYSHVYNTKNGFEHRQGFSFRKRLSCKGCSNCEGLLDYAKECLAYCVYNLQDELIKDGCYYRLSYDGDDFCFKILKER